MRFSESTRTISGVNLPLMKATTPGCSSLLSPFWWDFVVARERAEGRGIRPEDFIDQYFSARDSVNRLKHHFGGDIRVDLLLKNNEGGNRVYKANIERIDNYVAEKYTRADLEKMLLPR